MPKNTTWQRWVKDQSLTRQYPGNRAARRAYQQKHGGQMPPPMFYPVVNRETLKEKPWLA